MKMKSVAAVAALSLALSAAAASAQTPGSTPAGSTERAPGAQTTPGTDTNSPRQSPTARTDVNSPDSRDAQAFVREAAIGGMAEVELGRLAADKAGSADVKRFAQRMVTDHSKANEELKSIAQRKNLMVPADLDAPHKATKAKLSSLSGAAFDRAYMDEMRKDHRKDVDLFQQQARSGSDAEIKAFAAKTLPTLQEHLQLAEKTHAAVGTSGSSDDKSRKPQSTGTSGTVGRPGDRVGGSAPTPSTPGSPGTPGAGSDPRNQPGAVPGSGIQR